MKLIGYPAFRPLPWRWQSGLIPSLATFAFVFGLCAIAQDRRIVPVQIARKQALVIGNADYRLSPLKNPLNDAIAMQATLKAAGFEVTLKQNLDLQQMEAAIDEFTANVAPKSFAFVYFSGHGVQVKASNYLIPVDFNASTEADVKYKSYAASRLQDKLEETAASLRVIVLDACRNNPFVASRSAGAGLAPMAPGSEGTLIAFAASDRKTASDNPAANNGLYTKQLLQALRTPGLDLRAMFQMAKEATYRESQGAQNPAIYENLIGVYYLLGSAPAANISAGAPDPDAEAWNGIKNSTNAADYEQFIKQFPNSKLVDGAQERITRLRELTSASPAPALAPAAISPAELAQAGKIRVNPKDGQRYVYVPAGSFIMGCSPGDTQCLAQEEPTHLVHISTGFWLGQTPVTVGAWKRYREATGTEPLHTADAQVNRKDWNEANHNKSMPVALVSWVEAKAFCEWGGGRLPTEAEWEYAARAGNPNARYGELYSIAWYADNSGKTHLDSTEIWRNDQANYANRMAGNGIFVHPVAQKQPNAWGLYDMLGNVLQWNSDWYSATYYATQKHDDLQGPPQGKYRSLRGASFSSRPEAVRVSARYKTEPDVVNPNIGCRCVANLP